MLSDAIDKWIKNNKIIISYQKPSKEAVNESIKNDSILMLSPFKIHVDHYVSLLVEFMKIFGNNKYKKIDEVLTQGFKENLVWVSVEDETKSVIPHSFIEDIKSIK